MDQLLFLKNTAGLIILFLMTVAGDFTTTLTN
jgi:hypothetical protein